VTFTNQEIIMKSTKILVLTLSAAFASGAVLAAGPGGGFGGMPGGAGQVRAQPQVRTLDPAPAQDRLQTRDTLRTPDQLHGADRLQTRDQLQVHDPLQTRDQLRTNDPLHTQDRLQTRDPTAPAVQ
jgi:hypothetical protein